jgi:RHS repeat-associated protein
MERDEETGLEYHSARYYLPWLGRWLSSDPIGIGDGVNLYHYCGNNPIKLIDLVGHERSQNTDFEKDVERVINVTAFTGIGALLFAGKTAYKVGNAAIHGEISTDYLVPGLGNLAVIADTIPTAWKQGKETFEKASTGDVKGTLRAGADTIESVEFAALAAVSLATPFLKFGRTPPANASPSVAPKPTMPKTAVAPEVPTVAQALPPETVVTPEVPVVAETIPLHVPTTTPAKIVPPRTTKQASPSHSTLGRKLGLERAEQVKSLVDAEVGAVLELSNGTYVEGSSSTVIGSRPKGLSAHYKHAEIDALIEAQNATGTSGTMYVTEHPCAGACLTTNLKGNIMRLFESSGMKKLTIHSPEAIITLERSQNGKARLSSYGTPPQH